MTKEAHSNIEERFPFKASVVLESPGDTFKIGSDLALGLIKWERRGPLVLITIKDELGLVSKKFEFRPNRQYKARIGYHFSYEKIFNNGESRAGKLIIRSRNRLETQPKRLVALENIAESLTEQI